MTVERVHYRQQQRLRVSDLRVDQNYHVTSRRRHDRTTHGPGIVRGLELGGDPASPTIKPGVAIDALGRTLLVREELRVAIPSSIPADVALAIYLELVEEPAASSHERPRRDCGPGRHARWSESVRIRTVPIRAGSPDATSP